ncbi:MAG: hypothetical protein HY791_31295 [Deltaproteobacteria bacterium]|nr:hypothetical protein [Deltaproteobacteria bacterium]
MAKAKAATPPLAAPLPSEFVSVLLGVDDPVHVRFSDQIVDALAKISPDLTLRLDPHPLADDVQRGVAAFPELLASFRDEKSELGRAAILDAIGRIVQKHYATKEVLEALAKIISTTKSSAITSLAAKALALARDEPFLELQRNLLISTSPSQVRIAAKLCGYGKYDKAVPQLLALIHTDTMAAEAEAAVWALGEIGAATALPKLHRMLNDSIKSEDVLDAIGKIGGVTSVLRLLPVLLEGTTNQRIKAAIALARINRKNDGSYLDPDLERAVRALLEKVIDKDPSGEVRFYAIIAYSLLGGHLEPARVLRALGGRLSDEEMGAVSGFLARRGAPPKKAAAAKAAAKTAIAKKTQTKGRKPL